jgi:transposase InsO family protein
VWRILRHHRLNTSRLRYQLMVVPPSPPATERPPPPLVGELEASQPGDLVQMDCFHVGSFKETRLGQGKARRGVIWQYSAIDVASSFLWAELHSSSHNPDPTHTSALAYRVAQELRAWEWQPKAISTDNGNEFRAQQFRHTLADLDITHRFIRAGRPQSNGKVERVQGTLLEEFYKPVLSRYVEPSITGLRRDLGDYLTYYNWERRHSGRWNRGRTPAAIICPKERLTP